MNVTLYTINDTESDFCKQAKDFLTSHNIPFENKDVEHDRTALSAMLAVSENFSGVPVMVVGEGADQKVVKGFTPQEFEQALGLSTQPEPSVSTPPVQETTVAPTPWPADEQKVDQNTPQVDQSASMPAAAPVMPPVEPVAPVEPVTAPTVPAAPEEPVVAEPMTTPEPAAPAAPPLTPPADASHDDELKGIMDTLSQNGMPSTPAAAPVEPAPALEIPVDDHPAVTPPAEFTAAPASPEPVTPSVTEPSTWANQPASTMPAAPSAPAAPAWNAQPSAPVEPAAPTADMPSVPDFPQK